MNTGKPFAAAAATATGRHSKIRMKMRKARMALASDGSAGRDVPESPAREDGATQGEVVGSR
jgi:hypothetical protein